MTEQNLLHFVDFTNEYIVEFPCGHHVKISVDWMHFNFDHSNKMLAHCAALRCAKCRELSDEEEAEIQRQYEESIPIPGTIGAIERSETPINFKEILTKVTVTPEKLQSYIDEISTFDKDQFWYLVNKEKK